MEGDAVSDAGWTIVALLLAVVVLALFSGSKS